MSRSHSRKLTCVVVAFVLLTASAVRSNSEEVLVATATNFVTIMTVLAEQFEQQTGHEILIVSGSTGRLYSQILHGAPFDLFLSADSETPRLLEQQGRIVPGTRAVYAIGILALWLAGSELQGRDAVEALESKRFRRLAVANPVLAPYGRASFEVLSALGLERELGSRIILGDNVGQTYSFVATGNAELGFVALSQLVTSELQHSSKSWIVPEELHSPLVQELVILSNAGGKEVAFQLFDYLTSSEAQSLIRNAGYRVPG